MISFKTFITEAKRAPLYHATSLSSFESIVKENMLKATYDGHGQRTGKPTNFFTRSLKNAKHFGDLVYSSSIIFKIDQQKLNQRYRIQPIHNWANDYYSSYSNRTHKGSLDRNVTYGTEFEEIIEGNVKNFLSYVTNIYTVNGAYSVDKIYDYLTSNAKGNLEKYNLKIEELPKR